MSLTEIVPLIDNLLTVILNNNTGMYVLVVSLISCSVAIAMYFLHKVDNSEHKEVVDYFSISKNMFPWEIKQLMSLRAIVFVVLYMIALLFLMLLSNLSYGECLGCGVAMLLVLSLTTFSFSVLLTCLLAYSIHWLVRLSSVMLTPLVLVLLLVVVFEKVQNFQEFSRVFFLYTIPITGSTILGFVFGVFFKKIFVRKLTK